MRFGLRLSPGLSLVGSFLNGTLYLVSMMLLTGGALQAQTLVGSTSSTQTATVTIVATGTASAVNVLTQGAPNLDFQFVSGGSCSATGTYATVGATCTVEYTFTPTRPWTRYGGITLTSSTGTVLGEGYITGTGVGPETTFALPGMTPVMLGGGAFNGAFGVAVDGSGNIYVSEGGGGRNDVAEMPAGCSSTSCVTVLDSGFSGPSGLAVDGIGNVYVADSGNNEIKELPAGCTLSNPCTVKVLGGGFASPRGVAVDGSGNVYVADENNNAIKEMPANCTSASCVTTLGGGFAYPNGVAVDASGNVYVADTYYGLVKKMAAGCTSASCVTTLGGGFHQEDDVAVDGSGNVYVADTVNGAIKKMSGSCTSASCVTTLASISSDGIAVDGSGNVFFTVGPGALEIDVADPPAVNFATTPTGYTSSDSPQAITVSNQGNETLTLSGLDVSGMFSLSTGAGDCTDSSSVGQGASCSLGISFSPTGSTSPFPYVMDYGSVILSDDSLNVSTSQTLQLSGLEIAPVPTVTNVSPFYGAAVGGSTVTITGTLLTGATSVNFGSTPASFTVNSATSITATAPAGPAGTTVDVTVTTPNGTSVTSSADEFTYFIPGATASTENVGTTSASAATQTATLTITATGTANAINVTTQGVPNLDFSFVSGGTCSATGTYSTPGATCTVDYQFTPTHPGARYGGITLTSSSGAVLGQAYITGTGTGPQATFALSSGIVPTVLSGSQTDPSLPMGVVVDPSGNVYYTDYFGNTLKKIPAGCASSSCTITLASFSEPLGVALDGNGNLYIGNFYGGQVEEMPAGCTNVSCAITLGGGFGYPDNVAVDGSGNVYVSDSAHGDVVEMPAGCASAACTTVLSAIPFAPSGLAVDSSGNLYALNATVSPTIVEEIPPGCTSSSCVLSLGGGFTLLQNMVIDGMGNIYVTDASTGAVMEMPPNCFSASCVRQVGYVQGAGTLAVAGSGNLYVADTAAGEMTELDVHDPPSLIFTTATNDGSTDTTDGALSMTITNVGNEPLTAVAPGLGVTANFIQVPGSGTPADCTATFSLAQNASCNLSVAFAPAGSTAGGTVNGAVTLTDNNLYASPSPTQTIQLMGTAVNVVPTVTAISPHYGLPTGGTNVTITGTNFTGATVVDFGSIPAANFVVVNNTTITATAPPGTGMVNVIVTTPGGISAMSAAGQYTYAPAVVAQQAVASATLTESHAATSFTPVTGSGGTAPLSYSISPVLPSGMTISSATGAISGTPVGTNAATTYTITVTDANGATASNTFRLTVSSAVTATQSIASKALTQGNATSFTPVTGGGGTGALAYSIMPSLSNGLNLNVSTGAISGTPTAALAATTYTVTVTDQNSATAANTFSLTVNSAVTATQSIASNALTQNRTTNFTPVTGGGGTGTLVYSIAPTLPAGLSLSSATGAISGTSTGTIAAATFTVTVTDQNSATASNTFRLTINAAVTATQAVPSIVLTQNHTATSFIPVTGANGTGTLSYSVSPGLPGGLSLNSGTGAITGTPNVTTAVTTYTVTVTDTNGATASSTFTLTVNAAVTATLEVSDAFLTKNFSLTPFTPVLGGGGTAPLRYSISPTLPAGLSLSSSSGAVSGTSLVTSTAVTYTVTVTDANGETASNSFAITINGPVAASTAIASIGETVNRPMSLVTPVVGSGGTAPLHYAVSPTLPAGIAMSNTSGAISGLPTSITSAASYTVTVTDANNATATATFSLAVNGPVTASTAIAFKVLTQNQPSAPFTPLTVGGGTTPLSYSVSPNLPGGLSINSTTGAVSGSPTGASAATSYTVTVTDANGATANASFNLTVDGAVVAQQAVAPVTLTANHPVMPFTPVAGSGGTGSLTYSVSPGLPSGLNFSASTGTVSGTPSVASAAVTYAVTVTDGNGATATASFGLTVDSAVMATTTVSATTLTVFQAATAFAPVTGSGGDAPLKYSVSPGLPIGLSMASATGEVTGTPTVVRAAMTYTVAITDANNAVTTASFSLAAGKQATQTAVSASASAASPAQAVTLSATVAATVAGTPATPTGTVIFLDNGAQLGGAVNVVNGTAQLVVPSLPAGATAVITATYQGDGNFLGSTSSSSASVLVGALDFTFTTTGTSAYSAAPGAVASYSFALAPLYGSYAGPVSFSVTGLPTGATANVTPNTIAVNGGTTPVVVMVQTASATANNRNSPFNRGIVLALLFLPWMAKRRVRETLKSRMLLLVLLMAGLTATLTGCGSTGGFLLQSPQTYRVTVTATSGTLQHSQSVTLIVQ